MGEKQDSGCGPIHIGAVLVLQFLLLRALTLGSRPSSPSIERIDSSSVHTPVFGGHTDWNAPNRDSLQRLEGDSIPVFSADQPIPYPPCAVDEEAAEAYYHRWVRGSWNGAPNPVTGNRSGCSPGAVFTNMTFTNSLRTIFVKVLGQKSRILHRPPAVGSDTNNSFSLLPFAPLEAGSTNYTSILSAVGEWGASDPYWIAPGIFGVPIPAEGNKVEPRRFKYGIIAPELRCPTNLWHGLYEDVLPIFDVMVRMGWHRTPNDVVVLWPNVEKHGWGMYNFGCPAKSWYPHGLTNNTWMGRILFAVLNISSNEEFAQRVFFVQQHQRRSMRQPWLQPVNVEEVVPGNSRLCRAFRFPAEGGIRRTLTEYFPYQSPYYDAYSQHRYGPYCAALLESLSETVMRRDTGEGIRTVEKAFAAQKGLIRISVVVRRGSKSGMGRRLINQQELTDAIRREVGNSFRLVNCSDAAPDQSESVGVCVEVVSLEHLSTREQLQLMQSTTIFVCARGAGSLNTMFLPYGATIIYLNIMDLGRPVKNDQLPWNPGLTFLPRRTTLVMNCRAIVSGECSKISVNFCDMNCNVSKAATLTVLALAQTVIRLQRDPLLIDRLRKAATPQLRATSRRYAPYLQSGPFGSTYLLPRVVWRPYNYTVLKEMGLTALKNNTMEWFESEEIQFGPDW